MKKGIQTLRRHPFYATVIILFLSLASFTVAQMVEPAPAPSHFFPEGALVYLQTEDLQQILSWWTTSGVRTAWQASKNYEQFQNSRLFLKLQDRISKWGAGGNFSFTWDNLLRASGSESALALYDIGELKGIAATKIPFSKAQATDLWLARSRFVEKKSGSDIYYVEPREGILAFAYADPYLILATEETLLTQSLANLQKPASTLDQSPKWMACVKQTESDISVYLDQQELQQNRYFKKYWIHKNLDDFASIQATWIDLVFGKDSITERRFFAGPAAEHKTDSASIQKYIEQFQKFPHEFLHFEGPVDSSDAAEQILKMVNGFPENYKRTSYPPTFSGAAERAAQADVRNILLEQIDEPVLQVKSETLLQASEPESLSKLLAVAEPVAQVLLAYPLWDNQALFVRFPQTLVLQLRNFSAVDQQAFLDLILQHFLLLHSTQDEGGRWKAEGNGNFVLQTMRPLCVRFQDPWIVVSNEETDFRQVAPNLPSGIAAPFGSYAEVNWKNGRWKYDRLMRRLDHSGYQDESTPLFFSENIASLLYSLEPVSESTVEQFANQEIVRYELQR